MTIQQIAEQTVSKMLEKDAFSKWLGIKLVGLKPGHAVIEMTIRSEMVNGFHILHGGITFAFADSALAFASNSHGRISVVIQADMSFPAPVLDGDVLTAVAEEKSLTNKIGVYDITITNQDNTPVGYFRGTVDRKEKKYLDLHK